MRLLISIKLVVITCLLLLGVAVPISMYSIFKLEDELILQVESANMDRLNDLNAAFDAKFEGVLQKSRSYAQSLFADYKQFQQSNTQSAIFSVEQTKDYYQQFLGMNKYYSVQIYDVQTSPSKIIAQMTHDKQLQSMQQRPEYFHHIRSWQKFPFETLAGGQEQLVLLNSTFPKGPALFTLGFPLAEDERKKITHIAVVDLDLAELTKFIGSQDKSILFLTDKNGVLLAHKDEQKALSKLNYSEHPLIEKALSTTDAQFQRSSLIDPEVDGEVLGAFKRTRQGLILVSQIERSKVLEPVQSAKAVAIFISGCIISGAILLIFLFSLSISRPIELLADLVGDVSKGNFDVKAAQKVKKLIQDEVSDLAIAFDNMTEGLKERDKVKNLFSKFHGSSVTDDLLQKDVGLGGQSKDVAVFFSDVRGFTAFAEKKDPAEVVEMLNEYFGVMVKIINEHGGVVDKFIGDAIMAVWGAPKNSENDALQAVKACIEMRKGLDQLNKTRQERGQSPLMIGMGLHFGRAISGTIGSSERMEYTVIGNTVNTASRIEASTKAFGTDLLISQEVVERLGDHFWVDRAGAAEVKGRSDALVLYKVKGVKSATGENIEIKTPYSEYEAEKADKVKVAA